MARRTILFDLDGTLLPIDINQFLIHYMKALAAHMGHLIPPKLLFEQIRASTQAMISNTDLNLTNAEVFASDFFPKVGRSEAEMLPIFNEFYHRIFPALSRACTGLPGQARDIVNTALEKGHEIVLATNPLFPRVAIEERMRWAGIDDLPWMLVTTYEEMHATKPQTTYYQEILKKIGRSPDECLMVGNDVDEDGVAASLGMDLFFVTDFLINRSGKDLPPGKFGTLIDLKARLQLI